MAQTTLIDETELASLLCSRLCHDLLSPVGALNNGLEILAEETEPAMREQCLGLLGESARSTAGKLKFFRLAFGAAGGYGDAIPLTEARTALDGMFAPGGRLAVQWMAGTDSLPKPAAKVLLNLALMIGEALPRGGTLTVGCEQQDGVVEIVVRGEGPKLTFAPDLRAALAGTDDEPVSSRTVCAALVRTLVARQGGQLAVSGSDEPFLLAGASLPC